MLILHLVQSIFKSDPQNIPMWHIDLYSTQKSGYNYCAPWHNPHYDGVYSVLCDSLYKALLKMIVWCPVLETRSVTGLLCHSKS